MVKLLISLTIIFLANFSVANAASAVLIKFTDKTEYHKIGSAEILSDLILEKLLASVKFRLKESSPIDISAARKLYERNAAEHDNAKIAMETGNLDALFSGEGFNKNKAVNIDTAVTGQIVHPKLTRAIGEKSGVEYLIQGTIINLELQKMLTVRLAKLQNLLAVESEKFSQMHKLKRNFFLLKSV